MAKHFLVPVDGSPQADKALEHVFENHPDAVVTAIHIIDPIDGSYSAESAMIGFSEEWYQNAQQHAENLFEEAQERADEHGIELHTDTEVGRPARAIVEYAADEDNDIDHIVMGSHGRSGVSRILLGSVAETVVRRSSVPVTVVR
ncbi:MAG: universal stress protein [Halobacteriales archaeon]|nr:universal stress protein [Halobacteriales archaeon]